MRKTKRVRKATLGEALTLYAVGIDAEVAIVIVAFNVFHVTAREGWIAVIASALTYFFSGYFTVARKAWREAREVRWTWWRFTSTSARPDRPVAKGCWWWHHKIDSTFTISAYLQRGTRPSDYWPDVHEIATCVVDGIVFTEQCPRPMGWKLGGKDEPPRAL